MAISTTAIQDAIGDFSALLPEIGKAIAAKGANIGDDITTVEDLGEAFVKAAAGLGVPFAGTALTVAPIAHQLAGVFATWFDAKSAVKA